MNRIFLFILTNVAVLVVLSVVMRIFGDVTKSACFIKRKSISHEVGPTLFFQQGCWKVLIHGAIPKIQQALKVADTRRLPAAIAGLLQGPATK